MKKPISTSKAVQNLLMLLKIQKENALDRYTHNSNYYGEQSIYTVSALQESSTLQQVISMIENKQHFVDIANIYDLELK